MTELLQDRLARWKSEFPEIADFHQEITKMKLVRLEEQSYLEGLQSFYYSTSLLAKMLEPTLLFFEENFADRSHCNILSVGCGSGVFEVALLDKLLSQNKNIHFLGIDPNKKELLDIEPKLNRFTHQYPNFSFELFNKNLDSFSTDKRFDLIFCVHVFYYFSDIESILVKLNKILDSEGKLIIINDSLTAYHIPDFCILNSLLKTPFYYSQDIEEALERCQITFSQQSLTDSIDISDCFNSQSKLGKNLLNFTLGVHSDYLSTAQKQMFLDYLRKISYTNTDNKIICPYAMGMFCVGKWDSILLG